MSAQLQPEPVEDPPVYVITAAELRMRRVAGWVEQYRKTFGKGPRLTEIGAYVGFSSVATIFDLLTEMRELGFIQWEPRRQRTAAVLVGPSIVGVSKEANSACPHIEGRRGVPRPSHLSSDHRAHWTV